MLKIDNIPQELQELKQWVYYICEPKIVKGKQKLTKIPYQINGRKASTTSPLTWNTYQAVSNHYLNIEESTPPEHGHGIGFVFMGDYVGIDLDNHINAQGEISQVALDAINLIKSYSEKSISGTGVHIILKATDVKLSRNRDDSNGIEVYNSGRFFTMSGDIIDQNFPLEVFDRTDELKEFINKNLPERKKLKPTANKPSTTLTIETVIKRTIKDVKFNSLMDGDISQYENDHSRADGALVMKLAYYCDGDASLIDKIFRMSKLMREKWDEKHGDKTYGEYQITNALSICSEFYTKSNWDSNQYGQLKPTYNNCINFLENNQDYSIKFNEFSNEIEINKERFEDKHLIIIKESMRNIKFEPSVNIIAEAIKTVGFRNKYHPVKDYILGLKWDGNERCDYWLSFFCGADQSEYTKFVSRTIVLAIVNRVFRPGCQYDHMPIIEGDQGIGKSSAVRALGGEWYKEVSLVERDRDTIQRMQGAVIVEVAELAAFGKRDIDSLKAFITHPCDFARFAYAMNDKKYPRQSTFIGTVNPDEAGYLNDTTGNRRFLPVTVKKVDVIGIINARDQLFAEAYQLYLKGVPIYFNDSLLLGQAKEQQELRESSDPWFEAIYKWAKNSPMRLSNELHGDTISLDCMTCLDVYIHAIGGRKDACHKGIQARIGSILKKLKCNKLGQITVEGVRGRYWDLTPVKEVVQIDEKSDVDYSS